jgi:hypothetical protein
MMNLSLNLCQVCLARHALNLKLQEYVGHYDHIDNVIEVSATKKSKDKSTVKVTLSEFNSFFADVEQVQQTMVHLYDTTLVGKEFN